MTPPLDSIIRRYTSPEWRSLAARFEPRDIEFIWPATIETIRAAYRRIVK